MHPSTAAMHGSADAVGTKCAAGSLTAAACCRTWCEHVQGVRHESAERLCSEVRPCRRMGGSPRGAHDSGGYEAEDGGAEPPVQPPDAVCLHYGRPSRPGTLRAPGRPSGQRPLHPHMVDRARQCCQ